MECASCGKERPAFNSPAPSLNVVVVQRGLPVGSAPGAVCFPCWLRRMGLAVVMVVGLWAAIIGGVVAAVVYL